MKMSGLIGVTALVLAAFGFGQDEIPQPAGTPVLQNDVEKLSYCLGLKIGEDMKRGEVQVDPKVVLKGLMDGLGGVKPLLTEQQIEEVLTEFERVTQEKMTKKAESLAKRNQADGAAFLAANAKKQGVKETKTGLQYKILKAGTGPVPKLKDQVTTHYKGTLLDGTVFDSSYDRGEPVTFPVDRVIPGWTEALQMMPVGSKWQLFIPAKLAYGENGAGNVIGPNATLVFEVELLAIK